MNTPIKRIANIKDRDIDAEFENLIKQVPNKEDVVIKDTSGDPFIVNNFNDLYEIDKNTATLGDVIDFFGTVIKKFKEMEALRK